MTPKEKAIELVDNFKPFCGGYVGESVNKYFAKQSALIVVNEIRGMMYEAGNRPEFTKAYWQEVKQELANL
jgi:hypothetical protein